MVYIDFQAGTHGNFLEFVCNKFLANVLADGNPFNRLGASHDKKYLSDIKFKAGHYYFDSRGKKINFKNEKIISIQICENDLLAISSISLLRVANQNIDNDLLHINTYNKCNNNNYRHVLDTLINNFFVDQIQLSYEAVRDPAWPDIKNLADFKNLPRWIQEECINQHNLTLTELTPESPDCPRHILREFFKEGFKNPSDSSFIKIQQNITYHSSNDVYVFPFDAFYNNELFFDEIKKIAKWLDYKFEVTTELNQLHREFLVRQPYKNSKSLCDKILKRINDQESFLLPKLDLFQESYIVACLELQYNIILPSNESWFTQSNEILDFIGTY
jgi:hypothetical protein